MTSSPTIGHSRPPRGHSRSTSLSSLLSNPPSSKSLNSFVFPLIVLILIILASAAQTEVAHYLAANIGYHQPYFTFYLTHITFSLVFPLHLFFLLITQPHPLKYYSEGLRYIIAEQLGDSTAPWREITPKWSKKVTWLTLLVSIPALCWFVAMNLTTGLAVTTIYATSAFWTYLFSMLLLKQPLSKVTVGSIGLAFLGVIVLSLGDFTAEGGTVEGAPNPLLGDIIMMVGALILGLYEVVYKMALPEGHGGVNSTPQDEGYNSLPTNTNDIPTPPISRPDSPPLQPHMQTAHAHHRTHPQSHHPRTNLYPSDISNLSSDNIPLAPRIDRQTSRTPLLRIKTPPSPPPSSSEINSPSSPTDLNPTHGFPPSKVYTSAAPPALPTALHANFLTSCIGLSTLVMLWAPVPLLHWIGWETFRWPGSQGGDVWQIWAGLGIVAWGGAIYNAGLMVLIGIWGPTTSSVANLLTIGLVALIDAIWVGAIPTLQQLIGVGMICVGFGILLWEGEG